MPWWAGGGGGGGGGGAGRGGEEAVLHDCGISCVSSPIFYQPFIITSLPSPDTRDSVKMKDAPERCEYGSVRVVLVKE